MGKKIIVMGAGGWGTTLALLLSKKTDVQLWCYEKEIADEIELNRTNKDFLPDVELPENIFPFNNLEKLEEADIIINTIPTQFIRTIYSQIEFSVSDKIFVNGSKGIETKTLKRISEIFSDVINIKLDNYVSLTGPSHAEEVSKNTPTAVVAASINIDLARYIQDLMTTETFRVYSSTDVVGCELGGALKNVIAIAYGITDALGFGDNTKATVITRGLAEIIRLGNVFGANSNTISGLSGLGDLVVTCTSRHSRNRAVGELLGKGMSIQQIKSQNKMVAEGIETTQSAYLLAKQVKIDLPITEQVYNVIYNEMPTSQTATNLLTRTNKNELW